MQYILPQRTQSGFMDTAAYRRNSLPWCSAHNS